MRIGSHGPGRATLRASDIAASGPDWDRRAARGARMSNEMGGWESGFNPVVPAPLPAHLRVCAARGGALVSARKPGRARNGRDR